MLLTRGSSRVARSGPELELLAGFLESEVQGSIDVGRRFLELTRDINSGRRETWKETGNAYTIILRRTEVRIILEEGAGGQCRITLEHFNQALNDWTKFLSSHP